jgi:pimeloyl-ACP methyl ester carboxylesterase
VALANLETRVSDLLLVLDAVGSEHPILIGIYESGAANAMLAATRPERVQSMVWVEPNPRCAWALDYPWGRKPEDLEAELRYIGGLEIEPPPQGDLVTRASEPGTLLLTERR